MKKRTSIILCLILTLSMVFGLYTMSSAASVKIPDQKLIVGQSDTDSTLDYNQFANINSTNTSVATVELLAGRPFIKAVGMGTTTITYRAYSASRDLWDDMSMTLIVTSSSSSTGITVAKGGSQSSGLFSSISGENSSNPSIATVTLNTLKNELTIYGLAAGSTYINFNYIDSAGKSQSNAIQVTVTDSTAAGAANSDETPLTVGQTFNSMFHEIVSVSSSSETIASAKSSKITDGQHQLEVVGVSSGSVTVTVNFKETSTGTTQTRVLKFRIGSVEGTGASSSSSKKDKPTLETSKIPVNSATLGIYFPNKTVNAKMGKIYTIGKIKLNGTSVKASKLSWAVEDPEILTINTATGLFKVVGSGTSKVFAVDVNGRYMNFVTVKVD